MDFKKNLNEASMETGALPILPKLGTRPELSAGSLQTEGERDGLQGTLFSLFIGVVEKLGYSY